jgi:diguanylate cyclase (GGDEF)-like protein
MTLRAWALIYSVFAVGLVIVAEAAVSFPNTNPNWVAFIALVALATVTQFFEAEGTFRNTYYPHSVFFVAAAIFLDPLLFVLVVTIPHLVEWIVKRRGNHKNLRAWYIQPFNIATHIIAGYAVYLLYILTQRITDLYANPIHVVIVVTMALLYALLNHFLVGMALFLARGLSFKQSGVMNMESLLPEIVLGCLGYVMVVLWKTDPWLILPALSTLVLMAEALKIPQLKQDAQTDAKTGLLNAKYFNKLFTTELEQAQRYKRPLSLILADLDYMRNINNTYGHLAGDAVLAGIGKIMREAIPDENTAGRFGGEEFMIVLPGVECEDARRIAECLRTIIEAARFEISTQPEPLKATMSMGVASFPQNGTNVTELTQAADIAVYHAKHTGRNRVVVATEVPEWVIAEEAASRSTEKAAIPEVTLRLPIPEPVDQQQLVLPENDLYDPLTGLPNRKAWLTRLNSALSQEKYHKGSLGLLLFDLNRFNTVNNSLGHLAGDAFLAAFATRLRSLFRSQDFLARVGDDEFALLIDQTSSKDYLHKFCERVVSALDAPFEVEGQLIYLNTSIGVLLTNHSYHDPQDVMRDLNIALRQAKLQNNSGYVFFERTRHSQELTKFQLESEMRQAFEQGQFELYYQPKVELATGRIEGTEALLRWKHPERGYISPTEFIPLAEESGFICRLGLWVLEEAIHTINVWNSFPFLLSQNRPPLVMSINLSRVQFQQANLVEEIARLIREAGIDPAWLQLEITESLLLDHSPKTLEILHRLKELGLKLAIDDFGTGYSSLSYLKHFPLDAIKIDRSFISDMRKDRGSNAIVQSIIQLGRALRLKVVAEGVEYLEELVDLRQLGCEFGQGYYFAQPLPPEKLAPLLQTAYFDMTERNSMIA